MVYGGLSGSEADVPVVTRRRQAAGLRAAAAEVEAFADAITADVPPEVAGAHLRTAATALEELLGIISVEDVLDAMFREFCIGK